MNTFAPQSAQRGLTLIETCIVLAILAVVLGSTLPSFQQARERRHLEGLAAQLRTDVAHARSLAVARNESVRIGFNSAAACYVVHTGAAGACQCDSSGNNQCSGGAVLLRSVKLGDGSGVTLSSNSASMLFDAGRGTVTPTGTVKLVSASGAAIHSVVSIMGRVRNCSPKPGLPGYATC